MVISPDDYCVAHGVIGNKLQVEPGISMTTRCCQQSRDLSDVPSFMNRE